MAQPESIPFTLKDLLGFLNPLAQEYGNADVVCLDGDGDPFSITSVEINHTQTAWKIILG